eukprot:scaffold315_cov101-Isochrysis_galbana.AAC.7
MTTSPRTPGDLMTISALVCGRSPLFDQVRTPQSVPLLPQMHPAVERTPRSPRLLLGGRPQPHRLPLDGLAGGGRARNRPADVEHALVGGRRRSLGEGVEYRRGARPRGGGRGRRRALTPVGDLCVGGW